MGDRTCSVDGCENTGKIVRGWCRTHYERWLRHSDPVKLVYGDHETRFWSRVREAPSGCWEWTAAVASNGYGSFGMGGRNYSTHRLAWEWMRGEIPDDLQLDHLCRNRICVNPWHLEPVSQTENIARGEAGAYQKARTHCPAGHEYSEENVYIYRGRRLCRECRRQKGREQYHRRKSLVIA